MLHKIAAAKFLTRCQRGYFYPRFDMKIGFDMELFQDFSDELSEYLKLDSRGGYFLQEHMVAAITRAANGNRSAFCEFTSTNDSCESEAVETIAYQTRVVLSHFREKYKAFNALDAATRLSATLPSHPQWLRTLYEIVDSKISKTTTTKEKAPSTIRHPLRAFRLEQEELAEVAEEIVVPETPRSVMRYWEMQTNCAVLVKSDGTHHNATAYKPGPEGLLS